MSDNQKKKQFKKFKNQKKLFVRAKEICQLYYKLSGKYPVNSENEIALHIQNNTVNIILTKLKEKISYSVSLEDFVSDDYVDRLTARYQEQRRGAVIAMLDVEKLRKREEELRKREEEYEKAEKAYLKELKKWEKRAREICSWYYQLSGECAIWSSDIIKLEFFEDTVEILVTDYQGGEYADYIISMEDFIADDYAYRLKAKYQQKKQLEEKKKQKEIEDAERAELERLRKKYGE